MTKLPQAILRLQNEKFNGVSNWNMLVENCYLWRDDVSTDEPDEFLKKILEDHQIELSNDDFQSLSNIIFKESLGTQTGFEDSPYNPNCNFAF